jgi:hypothetical protein
VSFEAYKEIDAVNWTTLSRLHKASPKHYKHALDTHDDNDSTGRMLGRATHALVFEPAEFYRTHAVCTEARRGTTAWKAFESEHAGKEILKHSENADLFAQAAAVRGNPLLRDYLKHGKFEQTVTWTDPVTGIPCKARLDWVVPPRGQHGGVLLDLKGTPTVEPIQFGRIAAKNGYDLQLGGHYYNACKYGLGWEPQEVALVAVEFNAPFDVSLFVLTEQDITQARRQVAELLEKLAECRRRNEWPGHGADEITWAPKKQYLMLPEWTRDTPDITYNEDE